MEGLPDYPGPRRSLGWVVRFERMRHLVLYERTDPEAKLRPQQWLKQPSVVAVGEDWAVLADLSWKGTTWWVMGNNGVSVAGPGLVVGIDAQSEPTYLRPDQLGRIQVWQRSGGPRVLIVR
jgi:hypothetical protein